MTKKDYDLIAMSIWRSGFIKDKNKVRQEAKESIRRLIANDFSANIKNDKDKQDFLTACGL